jgi:hypothetical protein
MDERERDEPDLTEDPRKKGVSDQMPEEAPEDQVPGSGGGEDPERGTDGADAPGDSE